MQAAVRKRLGFSASRDHTASLTRRRLRASGAMRRTWKAVQIAEVAAVVAAPRASFISGTSVAVDKGRSYRRRESFAAEDASPAARLFLSQQDYFAGAECASALCGLTGSGPVPP